MQRWAGGRSWRRIRWPAHGRAQWYLTPARCPGGPGSGASTSQRCSLDSSSKDWEGIGLRPEKTGLVLQCRCCPAAVCRACLGSSRRALGPGPAWALREEPWSRAKQGWLHPALDHCCCATLYTSVACWAQPEPLWELPQEARWCSRPVEGTGTGAEAVRSCGKAAEHAQLTVSAGLAPKNTCDGFNMNMGSSWHASMALSVPLAMHCPYLHRPSSPESPCSSSRSGYIAQPTGALCLDPAPIWTQHTLIRSQPRPPAVSRAPDQGCWLRRQRS